MTEMFLRNFEQDLLNRPLKTCAARARQNEAKILLLVARARGACLEGSVQKVLFEIS